MKHFATQISEQENAMKCMCTVCVICTDEATDGKWYSDNHEYDNEDGDDIWWKWNLMIKKINVGVMIIMIMMHKW